jgi:Electron transfer DM13
MRRLAQLLAAIAVVAILLTGLWFFAGRVSDDFVASSILTAGWFGLAGLAALLVARRWRVVAVPVVAAYLVTAGGAGVWLASSLQDKVINERIAVAGPGTGNRLVASGTFTSGAHDTSGVARVVRLGRGDRALTLDLRTDAGPDLRVYLAPGDGSDVDDHVDLGGLKGNIGTQQYSIPADANLGRYPAVVIWCRAFSVRFGSAVLRSV